MSDHLETQDTPPAFVIALACDADRMSGWPDANVRDFIMCADDWQDGSLCWWIDFEGWRT